MQDIPNPLSWIDPWGWTTCRLSKADVDAMGPAPAGMYKPHLHHLIREMAPKNWGKAARGAIHHVQNLAKKYGIDVDRDPKNFVWASNGKGAHTKATAEHIRKVLTAADKKGKFWEALEELGRNANRGRFREPINIDNL